MARKPSPRAPHGPRSPRWPPPAWSSRTWAAAPQRSGVRATPQVKEIVPCPAPQTGSSNITALYTAAYGAPVVGKRLFVQVYQMVDGWESLPITYSALVPASG